MRPSAEMRVWRPRTIKQRLGAKIRAHGKGLPDGECAVIRDRKHNGLQRHEIEFPFEVNAFEAKLKPELDIAIARVQDASACIGTAHKPQIPEIVGKIVFQLDDATEIRPGLAALRPGVREKQAKRLRKTQLPQQTACT